MEENWAEFYRGKCRSWDRTLSLREHSSQTLILPFYKTVIHLMVVKSVINELTGEVNAGHSIWGQNELFIAVTHHALRGLVAISWLTVTAVLHWVDNNFTITFHAWKRHYHIILMRCWGIVGKLVAYNQKVAVLIPKGVSYHHCALKEVTLIQVSLGIESL